MTTDEMKRTLRTLLPNFHPRFESLLPVAIGEAAQILWTKTQWSFKETIYTFTADGSATKEMDSGIDSVLEITYGTNNRVVFPKKSSEINEIYSNVARTGDTTYLYTLHNADQDKMTIEFVPPIPSGQSVKVKALKKMEYGDISTIPVGLHGIILKGAKNFLEQGSVYATPDFAFMLDAAVLADKPIIHKRTSMGRDAYQAARTNEANSLKSDGGDTDRPID